MTSQKTSSSKPLTTPSPDHIITLDPAKIDASFVTDRLSQAGQNDETFDALVASIKHGGQQVPVLVRPHPDAAKRAAGWFQAAYGHRRIHATRTLGIPVNAQVRDLSDEDLVLAQGKENGERRDLSFIERAFFARGLLKRGFDRATVQQALSVDKAETSRLLQIADAMPTRFVHAIGPAPKAGRPRWLALAEELKTEAGRVKAADEITTQRFKEADSDTRFQLLFNRLSKRASARARSNAKPRPIKDGKGNIIARLTPSTKTATLYLDEKSRPGFADYLVGKLPDLAANWTVEAPKDEPV